VKSLDPSILANYLFELAKAFSLFYEKVPVLAAEEKVKQLRLLIIHDVRIVLTVGLELLGMPLVEKM
jgi:arginyl-tRNA synthetase